MVDLQAISEKLIDRSRRIVMAATGCPREEASRLLEGAGGSVKLAIVMGCAGVSRELAALYLLDSEGFVRRALEMAEAVEGDSDPDGPFAHYPARPPDDESLEVLRSALQRLPERIANLVEQVPDGRLRARPADDRWCVKEQIEHLIDCDGVMGKRIAAILAEDDPPLADRDDEQENRKTLESGARDAPVAALLGRLKESRAALLWPLDAEPAERFARGGRHEVYGPISVYQLLRHLAWHDERHVVAIRRLLSD
jgi:hypothetical protein